MQQDHQLSIQNVNFLHEVPELQLKQGPKEVIEIQPKNLHFEHDLLEMRVLHTIFCLMLNNLTSTNLQH